MNHEAIRTLLKDRLGLDFISDQTTLDVLELAAPTKPPALTVWYGEMPESNGRRNWTATIRRVNPTDKWDQGFCFARSEYPDRVRYEADRMGWIIGEVAEKPDILAYDADLHSGYVEPTSALQFAMGALEAVVSDCNLAASACDNEGPRKGFQHIANDATQALATLRGLPA